MTTRSPVSWFLTSSGRKFSCCIAVGAATCTCLANFVPQTFALSKYIDIVHLYKHGAKEHVSQQITNRFNKCIELLNIKERQRPILKPFTVFGYDLFHAGVYASKYGVCIGIPDNFNFQSQDDIDRDMIQVNLKPIDWTSETGVKLGEALVMSEKLQIFGMCREIMMTQTRQLYFDSICPMAIIMGHYMLTRRVNENMNFYARPRGLRIIFYSLASVFSLGLYFLVKDALQVHYETTVDKQLVELGQDFVEAGVEFYDKILKRNMALRHFMGAEGEAKYSALGNENFLLRHKRVPISVRKQFFEMKLKELQEKDSAEKEE